MEFAAVYCCGLAATMGIGAFWWLRTGDQSTPLWCLVAADCSALLLTIGWLSVVMTPIERSQPDMRNRRGAVR